METTALTGTTSTAAPRTEKAAGISTDFNTFLKMLTTQMQNQDPLNPIDSTDYAVQLATFSGVEQQTLTNQLLLAMQNQFGLLGMAQMAGWVGSEARAIMPAQISGDATVSLTPIRLAGADRAVLAVTDAEGAVVNRVELTGNAEVVDWLPVDMAGNSLPDGRYSFTLENYRGETQLETTGVAVYGRIAEVRGGTNGPRLLMDSGVEIAAADVTALRP
ncbi:MAG: flagellar hook assembly protein FlgD [Gemmobacter sp.]|jgi:flagellar basal-body rod modification protein FlgD|nr:flagellar hook assembly protein FlgD [Gemmobacter sp.]